MLTDKEIESAVKCIEIYVGDYSPEKQYAASIILKMLFKERYKDLMATIKESTGFKVNNRGDGKVVTWTKKVKAVGKCEVCGSTENLVAHHIIPWEYSIKGRTNLSNGQCLCTECHKMMHNDELWCEYMRKRVITDEKNA